MQFFKVPLFSSLIVRSLLSVFGMMVLVLGISGYINFSKLKHDMKEDITRDNLYLAKITSEAIKLATWNLDSTQIQQQLKSLENSDSFCGARVKDTKGNVFVDVKFPKELNKYEITNSTDIIFTNPDAKEQLIGTLELCYDSESINTRFVNSLYNQLFFMLFLMAVVLAVSYMSMSIIFTPLLRIRGAMAHLVEKMEPVSDHTLLKDNEIGSLTRTFNKMVEDLSNTYKRLEIAKIAAEQANIAKTEFLSNMSHELRTPMHAILSYSTMGLKNLEKIDIEKLRKYLKNIQISGDRLLLLVNALLDISQLESGEAEFEFLQNDVKELIEHCKVELGSLAQQKEINIIAEYKTKNIKVVFDKNKITQVMVNLFSNAIKFSPQKSEIHVVFEDGKKILNDIEKSVILCSFYDEGPGIPENELEKVFDKFVQSSKTKNGSGGTGLGLSICRQIIDGHGGVIWAENGQTKGAVFKVAIPLDIKPNIIGEKAHA